MIRSVESFLRKDFPTGLSVEGSDLVIASPSSPLTCAEERAGFLDYLLLVPTRPFPYQQWYQSLGHQKFFPQALNADPQTKLQRLPKVENWM
jgi:hypothetical protein